jgi:hypothetical protein
MENDRLCRSRLASSSMKNVNESTENGVRLNEFKKHEHQCGAAKRGSVVVTGVLAELQAAAVSRSRHHNTCCLLGYIFTYCNILYYCICCREHANKPYKTNKVQSTKWFLLIYNNVTGPETDYIKELFPFRKLT